MRNLCLSVYFVPDRLIDYSAADWLLSTSVPYFLTLGLAYGYLSPIRSDKPRCLYVCQEPRHKPSMTNHQNVATVLYIPQQELYQQPL